MQRSKILGHIAVATAVGIAMVAALPAGAQLSPGYSGQPGIRYASNEEYFSALSGLGSCLAETKRKQSLNFLKTGSATPAEGAAVRQLLGNNVSCLRHLDRMGVERKLLRGAIAQALYKMTVTAPLPAVNPPVSAQARMPATRLEAIGYDGLIESFTTCLAAQRPDLVHALLVNTRLASKDEEEAVDQMRPAFSSCLPGNIKLDLHPAELRLAIAESAFRRLAPPGGGR